MLQTRIWKAETYIEYFKLQSLLFQDFYVDQPKSLAKLSILEMSPSSSFERFSCWERDLVNIEFWFKGYILSNSFSTEDSSSIERYLYEIGSKYAANY